MMKLGTDEMGSPAPGRRASSAILTLAFAVSLAVFLIGPALLPATSGPYPLLRWGDILDLGTAPVVLAIAWLLFRSAGGETPARADTLVFVALAGVWAAGQGMHLAANAIGHTLIEDAGDAATLTYDLDEVLSHYLWHAALLGLTALIVRRALSDRVMTDSRPTADVVAVVLVAAVVFGFTFFVIVVEGQTAIFGLPGAAVIALAVVGAARGQLLQRPPAAMFAIGYAIALVLSLVWAGLNDWQLVEFSKAGLIE